MPTTMKMHGQLKSHSRQTRRSSRNAASSAGSSEDKSRAMSGHPLSPAKKLAKLMRERPLNTLPETFAIGVHKTVKEIGTKKHKKQDAESPSRNPDGKRSLTGQHHNNQKKPAKRSSTKQSPNDSASASATVAVNQSNADRSDKKRPGKEASNDGKMGNDANSGRTAAKKRSKHEQISVGSKRPKKEKVANSHQSSGKEARYSEQGPSTSDPVRKRRVKKHRPKSGRDVPKADTDPVAGGDIAALLRLGEGADADHTLMSDDSDWEAVDTHASDLATKGFVEVTLPSDVALQKRQKKSFDVEAYMKRQLSKARREMQVLLHKTHLLCLLSRTLQLNMLLNSETALACAMSMLPSKYAYPPKRVSLTYVEKFLKWFREKVPLEAPGEGGRPSEDVFRTLEMRLRTKKAYSSLELVCLFVLILRAIGVDCRLVISLQPTPLKPTHNASGAAAAKPQKPTPAKTEKSTSKSKQQPSAKRPKQKDAKPPDSGKRTPSSASASKSKRAAATPPARAGSDRKAKRRPRSSAPPADSSEDSSGDEFEPRRPDRRVLSSPSSSEGGGGGGRPPRAAADHWAEVYVEEELRWISVDVVGGGVHCVTQIRKRASAPMVYVLGCDNGGHVKELTARYDPKWHSATRKLRVDADWWEEAIGAWRGAQTRRDQEEDEELLRDLQERPMPQSVAEFKDHPLYALERHLLKFEAIYPPTAVPLGYVGKGEKRTPVYARECVRTLHSRETWIKQARVVREGEKSYKVVKARPKWDRVLQKAITDRPLEVFGKWQTEDYVPPAASGGKVPRNDYGNVELFKPSMLPGGTVHLNVEGLSRVAKRLGVDCAPAMVGWDYHCGGSHPVFEGYVVCEEFEDTLMDAWEADQREVRRRQRERREKRVLGNWRKLVRGLLIRQRLAKKYSFKDEPGALKRPGTAEPPATASKKARTPAGKQEPKLEPTIEPKLEPKLEPEPEPKEKPEPRRKRESKVDGKSEPKPAAKLSAKMKAAQASKPALKQEPKEPASGDEEVPETQEEVARRVEASMASMALRRLTLSSDSEADSDADAAGAVTGVGAGGGAGTGSGSGAGIGTKASPVSASAGTAATSAPPPAQRRRRVAPAAKKRRSRKASPTSRSPSPTPAPAAAGATRRRSRRVVAVNYSERAGSGSDSDPDRDAPLREDDLTSDEEQPFVRAAERGAVSSDGEDFDGF